MYHKTDLLGLQNFLRDKFALWARNRSCVEEIWTGFKEIVYVSIQSFVPHKLLRKKNPDPEYYNKEVKRLKIKVRKAYNKRKLGKHNLEELKRLSKKLFATKKKLLRRHF